MLTPGLYRHYKGGVYKVHFTALDKDRDEIMVVYESAVHGTLYVRPLEEFTGLVVHENNRVPRYAKT